MNRQTVAKLAKAKENDCLKPLVIAGSTRNPLDNAYFTGLRLPESSSGQAPAAMTVIGRYRRFPTVCRPPVFNNCAWRGNIVFLTGAIYNAIF